MEKDLKTEIYIIFYNFIKIFQTFCIQWMQNLIFYFHGLTIRLCYKYWTKKQEIGMKKKLEFVKNPVIAEFLGYSLDDSFTETELESSIINNLQKFLNVWWIKKSTRW